MKSLMVFTSKSVEEILQLGGTGHWNLTPSRVSGMEYAVCTFCDTPDPAKGRNIIGCVERGSAFLVGRISGIRHSKTENGRQRFIVEFSEYAELNELGIWDHSRNPVRYIDQAMLESAGINFDKLAFKPMPQVLATAVPDSGSQALTIGQAKAGLAKQFGVLEDQIQIVISA